MEHKNFGATSLGASPSVRAGEWSAGWRTLLGGFLAMSTAWNVVSISLSVFLKPMQATFGWSRTELSIAPLASLLTAFLFPVTGLLLDRFGARKVAIAGTAAMGGALALFAVVPLNPTIFAALIVLLALAGAAINSFVLSRGVASIFQKNLGSALGILLSGVSVALAVLVPAISSRVAMYGWQAGFAALSALALLFSLPVVNGCEKPTLNGGVNQRYEWSRSAERFGNGLREDREALPGASEGARRASADAPDAARFRMW